MILLFAFRKIRWSTPIDRDPRRKSGLNGCRDPPPPTSGRPRMSEGGAVETRRFLLGGAGGRPTAP